MVAKSAKIKGEVKGSGRGRPLYTGGIGNPAMFQAMW